MERRDIERDDAGGESYTPETSDYVNEQAARLKITREEAFAIYERGRERDRDTLAELPTPEPADD